jgi:hypothetical protein
MADHDIALTGKICSVNSCRRPVRCKSLCQVHYQRMRKHGDPEKLLIRQAGEGTLHTDGYWAYEIDGRVVLEHVLIVERAIGKRIPPGAQVHHVDQNRMNNATSNLVACQDSAYHQLLHRRQRAYDACGHADWLRCSVCHQWSPPSEIKLYQPRGNRWHPACSRVKFHNRRKK